jgi:hypothetical protein
VNLFSAPVFRSPTTSTLRSSGEPEMATTSGGDQTKSAEMGMYPWRTALLTAGLVLLCLFLRRPEAFAHPTLWAEDGSVFLAQSESFGARALVMPYNGYHHFLQRLIAMAVSPVDLRWIPLAYLLGSALTLTALVLALFSPRLTLRGRAFMALALVLIPHSGEVHDNLTNVQWFGALGLLLLVLVRDPETWMQRLFDLTATAILGLTGIFSLLFAPFFAWRWWRRRDLHSGMLAAIALTCAAVQAGAMFRIGVLAAQPWQITGSITRTLALRTFGSLTLPQAIAQDLPTWTLVLLAGAMLGLIAQSLIIDSQHRTMQIVVLLSVFLLLAGTLYRFRGDVFVLRLLTDGDRYFYVPKVLLLWFFVWQLATRGFSAWAARSVCVCALIAALASWRFEPYHDFGWAEHVAQLEHTREITVPINPSGMTVRLHARRAP